MIKPQGSIDIEIISIAKYTCVICGNDGSFNQSFISALPQFGFLPFCNSCKRKIIQKHMEYDQYEE